MGDDGIAAALAQGLPAMIVERPEVFGSRRAPRPLEVSGWAWSGASIERVVVVVDGEVEIAALHDLFRPDLRALFGDDLAMSGFTLRVDPRDWPPGWHELTVIATDGAGRSIGVSGQVESVDPEPPRSSPRGTIDPLPVARDGGRRRSLPSSRRDGADAPEDYARYGWAAPLLAGARVLDAGGASHSAAAPLAEHARELTSHDGDLVDLPFSDGEFDAVVCFEAIERSADTDRALDELRRVLRPGGLLLISAANRDAYPPGNPLHASEFGSGELAVALRARFANVAIHRQQCYVANALGDGDDEAIDLTRLAKPVQATAIKAAGGPPGSELYAVAAASDGELPPPPAQLAVGPAIDLSERLRLTEAWRERCVAAESELATVEDNARFQRRALEARLERHAAAEAALRERIRQSEEDLARARAAVAALRGSPSWRLTAPLRRVKRVLHHARGASAGAGGRA